MITSALISKLDGKNLSKSATLTAMRYNEALTSSTAEEKTRIMDLSGRSKTTLYNVRIKGVISARLLVATSFVLNVSPYWYTGESEIKEAYTDEKMRKFLLENKYETALSTEKTVNIKQVENPNSKIEQDIDLKRKYPEIKKNGYLSYENIEKKIKSLYDSAPTRKKSVDALKCLTSLMLCLESVSAFD